MRRILIGFVLLAILTVGVAVGAFLVLNDTLRNEEAMLSAEVSFALTTQELIRESNQTGRLGRGYLLTGDEAMVAQMEASEGRSREHLARLKEMVSSEEERALVARVEDDVRRLSDAGDALVVAKHAGVPREQLINRFVEDALPARAELDTTLGALEVQAEARFDASRADALRRSGHAMGGMILGLAGSFGASLVLGTMVLRGLRRMRREDELRSRLLTREREARAEVEEKKELLDIILEQGGDGLLVVDENGRTRVFNAEAARQHGIERGLATAGLDARLSALDGRLLPPEETLVARALRGETIRASRFQVHRADGHARVLSGTATPLRRADGALAGAVLATRDETMQLARERELAETLGLLDALLAESPVGIAFLDTDLRYVRINATLAAVNGWPVAAHLGRRPSELPLMSADAIEALLRRVIDTGEPLRGLEFEWPSDDEGPRRLFANYYPVKTLEGATLGVGAVVVDITERYRHEAQVQRTAEFRERFLGIVGHDLRNPLSAILVSARHLARGDLTEHQHDVVRRITRSAERMSGMIGELLDFARGRLGGGIPVERVPSDLFAIVRDAVEEMRSARPEREVRLEQHGDGNGEWDPGRMAQVVGNLVGNALGHGRPDAPVRVTCRGDGPQVVLAVQNDGTPIPPDEQEAIFSPFRRAEEVGSQVEGLGLGLFIVEQVVHGHAGTVGVTSNAEDGTTFTVTLPRHAP